MTLSQEEVIKALPLVAVGLAKYRWLQAEAPRRDVSADPEFQKRFGGFYRVRRNAEWRAAYFRLLEDAKSSPMSFADTLRALHRATDRVEASFASKLVATADPSQPVIDSKVVGNLGLKAPKATAPDRLEQLAALHQRLADIYAVYLSTADGRQVIEMFERHYPCTGLTEVKMLDLVLWQVRP